MYYPKFIPPKDMDDDVNPLIDAMIEAELERGFAQEFENMFGGDINEIDLDPDDLKDVL